MPIPFAAILAGFETMSKVASFSGMASQALQGVAASAITQAGNAAAPNKPPSFADLLRAYWCGTLTHDDLVTGAKWAEGISLVDESDNNDWDTYWRAIIRASVPQPSIDLATSMWRQGYLANDEYDRVMRYQGLIDPAVHRYMRERSEQLSASQVVSLANQGWFGEEEARRLFNRVGVRDVCIQNLLLSDSIAPAPSQVLDLLNRGTIFEAGARELLTANGLKKVQWQDAFLELRKQIPGPSDLVRFALREVWDPNVVTRYQYDADFPAPFQAWMERQGFGWSQSLTLPDGTVIPALPWPLAYWRAHWREIAPGQAYTFQHRFRANNTGPGTRWPNLAPWLSQNTADVLKIADYAAGFRPYLESASYNVIGRVDLRRFWKLGVIDSEEDLTQRYEDMGFTRGDAELMVKFTIADANKTRAAKLRKCLLQLYDVGGIGRQDAYDQLTRTGMGTRDADAELVAIDVCAQASTLKAAAAATRKAFLRGEVSEPLARQRLAAAGIVPSAIDYYLRRWLLEFTPRRKQLSTAQVLDAYERGYISQSEAESRLTNLGWDQPDRVILGLTAARIIAERAAKAQELAERKTRAAQRELERLAKEAEAQRRSLIAELNRIEPISLLQRLGRSGDLAQADFVSSLEARFIPPSAIAKWVEDTYGQS